MSSQTRTTGGGGGGGGRNSKKTNSSAGDTAVANKKTEHVKIEKEKTHAKVKRKLYFINLWKKM